MLVNRKTIRGVLGILLLQIMIIIAIGIVSVNTTQWFSNLFMDKIFVFVLVPLYMRGVMLFDNYSMMPVMTRMNCRKTAMLEIIKTRYVSAILFLSIWFSILLLISAIFFADNQGTSLFDITNHFFRYLLGFLMINNVLLIFELSKVRIVSVNPYILTYLFMALELLVLCPQIQRNTMLEFHFVFSWIFYGGGYGYIALTLLIVCTFMYLFKISIRRDIL